MPFFVLWGDIDPPITRPEGRFAKPRSVLAANEAFASREDAEAGIRLMTEKAAKWGQPPPEFRIFEAGAIEEAMSQVMGVQIPPRSA